MARDVAAEAVGQAWDAGGMLAGQTHNGGCKGNRRLCEAAGAGEAARRYRTIRGCRAGGSGTGSGCTDRFARGDRSETTAQVFAGEGCRFVYGSEGAMR